MTIETDAIAPSSTAADSEFDLDVRIVESRPAVADLMRITDDQCGATCESACPDSCPGR